MAKYEFWTIAYRKRKGTDTLLENTDAQFTVVPNTRRYWCADPFLFERDGVTYLFAEMYDRILRQGVIGYCTIGENGVTPWKRALKMPFHLSYPNVFARDGEICMIPESYVANEIALYRAVHFPDRWERVEALCETCAVDSTILPFNGSKMLIAQEFVGNHDQLVQMDLDADRLTNKRAAAAVDDRNVRPGGNAFYHNGKWYRPAQDCTAGYGCALNLNEITLAPDGGFAETPVKKVYPSQLHSDWTHTPEGVHTYNFTARYEAVDLKSFEHDRFALVMRIFWGVLRRVKKLVGVR